MPKSRDSSVQVAVIVAGLLAVVGGAWVFLNSGNEAAIENTQIATVKPAVTLPTKSFTRSSELLPVDTALQMAEMAFQSGQLAGDEEGTALDFYRQVIEQEPDNRRAKAGMQLIATQLTDEAEEMMGKGAYAQVVLRMKSLNTIEAGSEAVLSLQQRLDEEAAGMFNVMDIAIADGDLDLAERLAGSLRLIPDADSGRISSAMVTIATTRKDRETAALAQQQLESRNLPIAQFVDDDNDATTDPAGDSQTSSTVASADTIETESGVATNAGVQAAITEEPVDVIDPAVLIQEQIVTLLALASTKVDENRLIKPEGDNAFEVYNQILALDSTNAETKRGLRGLVQKMTSSAYDLAAAGNFERARIVLDEAESVGIAESLVTQAREDVRETWLESESQKVFAIGGFKVQKSVSPKYPKRAVTRSVEGWVKVEFTVAEDGNTRDLQVVESSKRLTKQFTIAAIKAVEQWQFEPRVLDGQVIAQRSETTVQFKLAD